jgi:hypothetical protein
MPSYDPTDDDELLTAMASTLDRFVMTVRSIADAAHGDFGRQSPGRAQWEALPDVSKRQTLDDAYHTGLIIWPTVEDHARGLVGSVERRLPHSAVTLARGLAESAARCWYLIEPAAEPGERIRRMLNDRLYANFEHRVMIASNLDIREGEAEIMRSTVDKYRPSIDARVSELETVRDDMAKEAKLWHLEVTPEKFNKYRAPYVGTPRPTAQSLIGQVLQAEAYGAGFHRSSSAVAHASLHGITLMLEPRIRTNRVMIRATPMTAADTVALTSPAVTTMAITALELFRQAGWPTDPLEVHAEALVGVWTPAISDVGTG